jgi:hypothetical protein
MTPELLSSLAGIVLSLAFSYIPGLNTWYDPKPPTTKRLIMLAALAVVTAGVFGLSCSGIFDSVTCDKNGAITLVTSFVLAMVANQSAYQLSTPRS